MKNSMKQSNFVNKAGAAWSDAQKAIIVALFALMPASAWAQDAIGENGAVCKFFSNINNILNIASIAVVTIAVIFAGYQIAFAHKRISDVAPVLIGGLLIGGAAQFAHVHAPGHGPHPGRHRCVPPPPAPGARAHDDAQPGRRASGGHRLQRSLVGALRLGHGPDRRIILGALNLQPRVHPALRRRQLVVGAI